jgi:Skp family chaperone for outer membrane proteins
LGPVAQDFYQAFGLGDSDRTISTVDANGVALAAIQGLNAKLEAERDALLTKLEAENAALRAESAELRAAQERLAAELAELRAKLLGTTEER